MAVLPFWPVMSAVAWRGWAHRLGAFSRRPLPAPSRLRVKRETRYVGRGFQGGANAAVDGVDVEVGGYVDLAVEGGDEVGELAGATVGAEVDLAFEGLFEQRGFGLGEAEIGARGAAFAGDVAFGELDPGAVVLMWALSTSSVGGRVTAARAMLA